MNGELSETENIKRGVPKGSVLGPLLFFLYINDLPKASNIIPFHLSAGDTSLFYSNTSIDQLEEIFDSELLCISDWLTVNKLTLSKSKSIL